MACKTNSQCDFCDARCPDWYDDKIFHILNEIYDAYKGKVEEATSLWKSEYSFSQQEDEDRDIEDKEDLRYFKELLQKIKEINNAK